MRVYSYIVRFDYGFAPNPFHGVCTLACCKPRIRRKARVGDLVVGLSSRGERVVYAMRVGGVLTFNEYWNAGAYSCKRPKRDSTDPVVRRGDNIYQPWGIGEYRQLPSYQSLPETPSVTSRGL
jgi:Nucleotide modification associated domain 2